MITETKILEARCRSCGYLLRDLPEPRCPECGRAFDLDNPRTISLPFRAGPLLRWMMRRPGWIGRQLPLAVVLLAAWGTRVPGFSSFFLALAAVVLGSCILATCAWWNALGLVSRRGGDVSDAAGIFRKWRRRVVLATVVCAVLGIFRPTMFISFWISYPWMHAAAKVVLAEPFAQTPSAPGVKGLYRVYGVRRCPHGVKLFVTDSQYYYDRGPGFFYRDAPGECYRFNLGIPLGGGWYASPY